MQQQAIEPIEMPTVPGAKVSHLQGLAKLFQAYIAKQDLDKAQEEKKQYEADTLSDMAKIYRNINEYETIPGTPAVPEQTTTTVEPNIANQNLQAVAARQMTRDPNAPVSPFERPIGMDERAQISQLPLESTQQTITPAVAAVPERKVPLLSFDSINDPNLMKSSAGRMMLAQALIQRQAQEQAKAEKALEIKSRNPEEELYRTVDGKVEIVSPATPKATLPKWEKSSKFDANGQEIMGWVNTNAPNIPASFVQGTVKPALTKAQQLDLAIRLYGTRVEAQKAIDEGRVPLTFDLAELDIKPLPPQGTELQIGVMYDTPKGRLRWNGTKFTSVD
jgi:hypothetical protein